MQNGHFMKFTYEILCKSNHSTKSFWFFEDNIVFLFLTHFMNFFRFRTHFGIIGFSEAFFSWHFYLFVNIYLQIFAPDFGENGEYPTLDIKKYDHFFICEALEIH